MQFPGGSTFHAIALGAGHIYVASEPVELAEGFDAVTQLYGWALAQAGITPRFDGKVPEGVLVRPVEFADSLLYLFISESAKNARFQVRDKSLGITIDVALPAGRAQMQLFEKKNWETRSPRTATSQTWAPEDRADDPDGSSERRGLFRRRQLGQLGIEIA